MEKGTQEISQVINQQHSHNQTQQGTTHPDYRYWKSQVTDEQFDQIVQAAIGDKKNRLKKLVTDEDWNNPEFQEGLGEVTITEEELAPVIKRYVQTIEGTKYGIEYAKKVYSGDKPFVPVKYNLTSMREYMCWWYEDRLKASGKEMIMTNEYYRIYNNLCKYFCHDPSGEYDLNKGLMLMGCVGDGKTMLMRCFQYNPKRYFKGGDPDNLLNYTDGSYRVVSASDIAEQYKHKDGGVEVLKTYRYNARQARNRFGHIEHGWCIDDIGAESIYKHFGDPLSIVEYIVTKRYDEGLITHYTTNLNAEELLANYGERVVSRLRERCNQIVLPMVDLRK